MIRKCVVTAGVLCLLQSTAFADSFLDGDEVGQPGNYIGILSGISISPKTTFTDRNGSSATLDYDTIGIPVSVSAGHQFGSGLRAEGELFYKTTTGNKFSYSGTLNAIDSQMWSVGAMGNLYYDFFHDVRRLADGLFLPYVGFGAGFANVHLTSGAADGLKLWNSGDDTVFAYQAIVGASMPIRKNIMLDLSYRYFGTTKVHVDQIKTDYNNQNYLLGVRYIFN